MTAPTGGGTVGRPSTRRAKVVRITTGVMAGVVSLALALLLTSFPEVSERFRAEDHASDAFIFAWTLVALPVAGVLHTPLALARRARIGGLGADRKLLAVRRPDGGSGVAGKGLLPGCGRPGQGRRPVRRRDPDGDRHAGVRRRLGRRVP